MYVCVCVFIKALLEVFGLGAVAALTSVRVQRAGVKHLTVVSLAELYATTHNKLSSSSSWLSVYNLLLQRLWPKIKRRILPARTRCRPEVKSYRVSLPRRWQVSGLCRAAVWTDCVLHPAAAHRPHPSRLYWDLQEGKKNIYVNGQRRSVWFTVNMCRHQGGGGFATHRRRACGGRWRLCWSWVCLPATCPRTARGGPDGDGADGF